MDKEPIISWIKKNVPKDIPIEFDVNDIDTILKRIVIDLYGLRKEVSAPYEKILLYVMALRYYIYNMEALKKVCKYLLEKDLDGMFIKRFIYEVAFENRQNGFDIPLLLDIYKFCSNVDIPELSESILYVMSSSLSDPERKRQYAQKIDNLRSSLKSTTFVPFKGPRISEFTFPEYRSEVSLLVYLIDSSNLEDSRLSIAIPFKKIYDRGSFVECLTNLVKDFSDMDLMPTYSSIAAKKIMSSPTFGMIREILISERGRHAS